MQIVHRIFCCAFSHNGHNRFIVLWYLCPNPRRTHEHGAEMDHTCLSFCFGDFDEQPAVLLSWLQSWDKSAADYDYGLVGGSDAGGVGGRGHEFNVSR